MKTNTRPFLPGVLGVAVLVLAQLLFFCGSSAASEKSFLSSVKETTAPFDTHSVEQVQPIVEETVPANEQYQGGSFRVLARKSHIQRYKCSGCHSGKIVLARNGAALTHGTVELNHGIDGNVLK
ncbi:MAG: hypothetical protein IH612_03670, partial [Desulfofustis sp.]|nr:hypothetical protein [Desulfofustis sp.]